MQILFCLPCSQPEKLENAVPFATGIFRKLKPEFLVEWKAPLISFFPLIFHSRIEYLNVQTAARVKTRMLIGLLSDRHVGI